mgnify:CR=1 FL=1
MPAAISMGDPGRFVDFASFKAKDLNLKRTYSLASSVPSKVGSQSVRQRQEKALCRSSPGSKFPAHTSSFVHSSLQPSPLIRLRYMMRRTGNSVSISLRQSWTATLTAGSDLSKPDFHGILPMENGYIGPFPTPELHPHLRLDQTMTSVPKVYPGDMVFWHCDLIHSVERVHNGSNDSAGRCLFSFMSANLLRLVIHDS